MKCQILFSGKNKRNITSLSSVELAQRKVKVKVPLEKDLGMQVNDDTPGKAAYSSG